MSHQLLNIDDALVTGANPARDHGTLDVKRCARLHNYIFAIGWMAKYRKGPQDLDELLSRPSFFEHYGEEAQSLRGRMNTGLAGFLASVIVPFEGDPGFFIWVGRMVEPSFILDHYAQESFLFEEPEVNGLPRFALLYPTVSEMGPHTVGLVYDQKRHCVAFPLSLDYIDNVSPVAEHLDMWFPLETMLSNWINLIRIGKVAAQPDNDWPGPSIDVWRWFSYGAVQVDSAVEAFDRLTTAIEARMPSDSLLSIDGEKPLLTHADLDAASVSETCFIRSFFTQIKTPRFKAIAPGVEVPHNADAFAARQKFTFMPRSSDEDDNDENYPMIPPVLIFAASDSSRTVNFDTEDRYSRLNPFHQDVPRGDHSTPAGLYSESVRRLDFDNAEEGFRLLLPFRLRENDWQGQGARRSDGSLVAEGSVAELFQHGFLPFGGEHRTQRLERLLDQWREMVESGIWTVGRHGVEGTIDTFRDADSGAWKDYWIPPGW